METNDECSICFELMKDPSMTACGHYFCLECLRVLLFLDRRCPICRETVPGNFKPVVDQEYLQILRHFYGEQYEKVKRSAQKEEMKVPMRIHVGASLIESVEGAENPDVWLFHLKTSEIPVETLIHHAVLYFGRSYMPSEVELEAPFYVKVRGSGDYDVTALLFFHSQLDLLPVKLTLQVERRHRSNVGFITIELPSDRLEMIMT